MNTKTKLWLKMAVAAVVTGASNAGLASLGISGANLVGIQIPTLDLRQLSMMCLSGGVVGLLAYLQRSPVPPNGTEPDKQPFVLPKDDYNP